MRGPVTLTLLMFAALLCMENRSRNIQRRVKPIMKYARAHENDDRARLAGRAAAAVEQLLELAGVVMRQPQLGRRPPGRRAGLAPARATLSPATEVRHGGQFGRPI